MKGVGIAERVEIELERFALDALLVRHVTDDDMPEIGLAGDRAERCVFRAVEFDDVVAVGVNVVERFEFRLRRGGRIVPFRRRQQRQVVEPFPGLFGIHICLCFRDKFNLLDVFQIK